MNRKYKFSLVLFGLVLIAILVELFRDTFAKPGDFRGYALVGNFVLNGEDIYTDPLINTWPPFFSLISVPIALLDNFNKYFVRFIWLTASILAMAQVMNYTCKLALNRKLSFFPIKSGITITDDKVNVVHWVVLVPLIIILRYLLDNLSNIQINIFMLLFALSGIYFFSKNRYALAAFILAFSISIKVYTIFLLLYFIVKREYKIAGYTILFCMLFSIVPFFVFGVDQTLDYYTFWYKNTIAPFAMAGHKNQSFFSMMRSLLMHDSPGLNGMPLNKEIYINFLSLTITQVKVVSYAIVALIGSLIVYLFRKKLTVQNKLKSFIEFAFILNIIPILSPLAWKAYFIFLFPSYFLNYLFLYQSENSLKKTTIIFLKIFYYISILLTVFSSELFTGAYFSDILEVYSVITIGTILIAVNLVVFYINFDKFSINLDNTIPKKIITEK